MGWIQPDLWGYTIPALPQAKATHIMPLIYSHGEVYFPEFIASVAPSLQIIANKFPLSRWLTFLKRSLSCCFSHPSPLFSFLLIIPFCFNNTCLPTVLPRIFNILRARLTLLHPARITQSVLCIFIPADGSVSSATPETPFQAPRGISDAQQNCFPANDPPCVSRR